jgi:predicted Zn-dependent protease
VTNKRQTKVISQEAERRIGQGTRDRLVEDYGELKDSVLREYVAGLGRKLVLVSDRPRLKFHFTILDSDLLNAFAAPGGFVFVTRGLLSQVENEAELAVVLGHEIAHVCALHSVVLIQKQLGYGALGVLGAILAGVALGPEAMVMVGQTADLFTGLYLLGYSREHEREADRVGLRYAISAGYNPQAALSFFHRLEVLETRAGGEEWEPYSRSHPAVGERILLAQGYVDRRPPRRPLTDGQKDYQSMKARLPHPASGSPGTIDGRRFTHSTWGISLEIPPDWVWDPYSPSAVVGFHQDKGPAWGELRREVWEVPLSTSTQKIAEQFASRKKWKFLRGRELLYPSGSGYLATYAVDGLLGGNTQYRAFFIVRDPVVYILLCAAPLDKITDHLLSFEQILRSFK